MNVTNLIKAIHVMDRLVTERPELHDIDMSSVKRPICGTPGCHAGLWDAVFLEMGIYVSRPYYDYENIAAYVHKYLEIKPYSEAQTINSVLPHWPVKGADKLGSHLWSSYSTFTGDTGDHHITGKMVVDAWKQYLNNYLSDYLKIEIRSIEILDLDSF